MSPCLYLFSLLDLSDASGNPAPGFPGGDALGDSQEGEAQRERAEAPKSLLGSKSAAWRSPNNLVYIQSATDSLPYCLQGMLVTLLKNKAEALVYLHFHRNQAPRMVRSLLHTLILRILPLIRDIWGPAAKLSHKS